MTASIDQLRCEVEQLAAALLADVEQSAARSVARMRELLPSFAELPAEGLLEVTLSNMRDLLEAVRNPDADPSEVGNSLRASGEDPVRLGITREELIDAWWIGQQALREDAHSIGDQLGIGDDVLLGFVEASLRWGDVEMRRWASAFREAEIRELEQVAAEQAALRRVATVVARGAAPEEVFAAVAEEVGRVLPIEYQYLGRFEPDGMVKYLAVRGPGLARAGRRRLPIVGDNVTTRVFETGRPARTDYSNPAGPIDALAVEQQRIRWSVGAPIIVEGRRWGVMIVSSTLENPPPPDTEQRLTQFVELLAAAIANAETRADLQQLAEEQAALRRLATLVVRGVPAGELFGAVTEEVGRVLSAEYVSLIRYEPDYMATDLAFYGTEGFVRTGPRLKLGGKNCITLVFETGRSARIDDFSDAFGPAAVVSRERVTRLRSSVATPIFVEDRLWGAIGIASTEEHPLPTDTETRLVAFTDLVATAIANAESLDQLTSSRTRLVTEAYEARRRVVRDLHDGAQQGLVHTIIALKLARRALDKGGQDAVALVSEALEHAETANRELRELVHGILPSVLTRDGLRAGVDELAARMSIPLQIDVGLQRLPTVVEATAYLIVAGALTNVEKHAQAERAEVKAFVQNGTLHVEVHDNGIGGADLRGHGLVGLSDRVTALEGRLSIESPPHGGTTLTATLPLNSKGVVSLPTESREVQASGGPDLLPG